MCGGLVIKFVGLIGREVSLPQVAPLTKRLEVFKRGFPALGPRMNMIDVQDSTGMG